MSRDLYDLAKKFLYVKEPNPIIKTYFKEGCGVNYDHRTPWCSAFMNYVARKAGYERTKSTAALSWRNIGIPISKNNVQIGDLAVFYRGGKGFGHVGIFGGWVKEGASFKAISGNYGGGSTLTTEATFSTGKTYNLTFIGFRRLSKVGFIDKAADFKDDALYYSNENIIKPVKKWFDSDDVDTEINKPAFKNIEGGTEYKPMPKVIFPKTKIKEVKEVKATGIWQIIKLVTDQYSLSQTVNDATINNNQGSLLNFVQKVIQRPWLQFRGTTIGNQYYFYSRKEPFDFSGWQKMPVLKDIDESEVLSENLSWYDGDIFSWYQLTPRGNFYTEQHIEFGYVSAVYFEEYADIWGSKPLSHISNYVNYYKIPGEDKDIMSKKAMTDLKYMVESNCYLPFTRTGSLVILGDNTIKSGFKIRYKPTGEIFYVDSVSHNMVKNESGMNFQTTLNVSRGMKEKYINAPINADMISYFNIISFDTEFTTPSGVKEEYKKPIIKWKVNRKIFDFFLNKRQNGTR